MDGGSEAWLASYQSAPVMTSPEQAGGSCCCSASLLAGRFGLPVFGAAGLSCRIMMKFVVFPVCWRGLSSGFTKHITDTFSVELKAARMSASQQYLVTSFIHSSSLCVGAAELWLSVPALWSFHTKIIACSGIFYSSSLAVHLFS